MPAIFKYARKLISGLLTAPILFAACSCSSSAGSVKSDKLKIVTTIFPEYDWVRNIAGDNIGNIELTLLCDNGVDMHSYQPTASDIIKISSCDVFVYVGGESDEWVEDALKEAVNKDMKVVNLMAVLDGETVQEEIVDGMQTEEEDEEDGGVEYDEHVWLSLNHAQRLVIEIAKAMGEADPDNRQKYDDNAEAYGVTLYELDLKYQEVVNNAGKDTLLFGDRFPFRYLTDDYNLKYYAAFAGCSAETEASFDTVVFLANKVDELGLTAVITIDSADQAIAKTIIENTTSKDQAILVLDSMQSTKTSDNRSYVDIMESNLEVLKKALG
ncbi:MAG: zinc ABC transporter substrate-binding protein [Clostridiales bacterium]|nr:zinc ABC transporter substrate-binding protein [Clostridiales bacterium]